MQEMNLKAETYCYINSCMEYMSDQKIYGLLRVAGVVSSQYHLSALCHRSAGWFSSTRRQGRQMTPAALTILVCNLLAEAERQPDALSQERLRVLARHIQAQIRARALSKPRIKHRRKSTHVASL